MGLLKSIGKVFKSVTKPIKKVIKSPVGIAALVGLGLPAYAKYGAARSWPGTASGILGKGSHMARLGDWLYGTAAEQIPNTPLMTHGTKGIWGRMGNLGRSATIGGATALTAGVAAPELEEAIDISVDDPTAHNQYLTNRGMYEDEWADWLVSSGKAGTKEEALELVRSNPMFSGGGRVKANLGLYAGGMGGMNQGMNPGMNPMTQMNQGLGSPNLGPRSMGMTPGIGGGGGQDPRMAQLMQGRGRPRTAIPKQSEDTELIQLIKMLTSMGIPMEQLRGRTKEELVEMVVSVSGKTEGGRDVKETAEVIEEEDIREQQAAGGGLMRTGYAIGSSQFGMGTEHPIIGDKDGPQLDMRDSGGYQPHGKKEKHDDVRAVSYTHLTLPTILLV